MTGASDPVVLALDLATTTGWAVDHPAGYPANGTYRLRFAGDGDYGAGFVAFCDWLGDMITVHKPGLVAFEAPLGNQGVHNASATRILIGLATLAETISARHAIDVVECNIHTVRKHFAGSGRSQKQDVMLRCRSLGWAVVNHDAADACAVWDYAKAIQRANRITTGRRST